MNFDKTGARVVNKAWSILLSIIHERHRAIVSVRTNCLDLHSESENSLLKENLLIRLTTEPFKNNQISTSILSNILSFSVFDVLRISISLAS
jgi:hypothetical protein